MRALSEKLGQRNVIGCIFIQRQKGWENSEYLLMSVCICIRATENVKAPTPSLPWLF